MRRILGTSGRTSEARMPSWPGSWTSAMLMAAGVPWTSTTRPWTPLHRCPPCCTMHQVHLTDCVKSISFLPSHLLCCLECAAMQEVEVGSSTHLHRECHLSGGYARPGATSMASVEGDAVQVRKPFKEARCLRAVCVAAAGVGAGRG